MILPIFELTDSETGDKYPGLVGPEMKLFINNNHYQLRFTKSHCKCHARSYHRIIQQKRCKNMENHMFAV
jgi:hypothetical protein